MPISLILSKKSSNVIEATLVEWVAVLAIAALQVFVSCLVQDDKVLMVAQKPKDEDAQK